MLDYYYSATLEHWLRFVLSHPNLVRTPAEKRWNRLIMQFMANADASDAEFLKYLFGSAGGLFNKIRDRYEYDKGAIRLMKLEKELAAYCEL